MIVFIVLKGLRYKDELFPLLKTYNIRVCTLKPLSIARTIITSLEQLLGLFSSRLGSAVANFKSFKHSTC